MKREHLITGALLDGGGLAKIVGKRAQNFEQVGIIGDFFQKRRIDAGRESGVNSRGCFLRIWDFAAIKNLLEQLGVIFAVLVHDMGVLICHHLGLRVTGVSLDGFDVTAGQLQFISDAGVAQGVKNHLRQIVFFNQRVQKCSDACPLHRMTQAVGEDQVVVGVLTPESFHDSS